MKKGSYCFNFCFISEANHLCMEYPILKDHNTEKKMLFRYSGNWKENLKYKELRGDHLEKILEKDNKPSKEGRPNCLTFRSV